MPPTQREQIDQHFQSFLEEFLSIIESEPEGQIRPESINRIKKLVKEYWKLK